LIRIARHRATGDHRQAQRDLGRHAVRRHDLGRLHGGGDLVERLALERLLAHQQLVQHDAERIHVAAPIHRATVQLFGCEVERRAGDHALERGHVAMRDARNAEVQHLGVHAAGHEDVGGLHVAMHDALAVRVGERVGDAAHHLGRLDRAGAHALQQQVAQVLALQALHGDVDAGVGRAGVEHGDDVRVRQPGGRAGLVQEQRVERLAGSRVGVDMQGLERDGARQQRIPGRVDGAEAALAEDGLERVAADVADAFAFDARADARQHRGRRRRDGALGHRPLRHARRRHVIDHRRFEA
jgi:hypothetical protein